MITTQEINIRQDNKNFEIILTVRRNSPEWFAELDQNLRSFADGNSRIKYMVVGVPADLDLNAIMTAIELQGFGVKFLHRDSKESMIHISWWK